MNQSGLQSLILAYATETKNSAVQLAWRSIVGYGVAFMLCGFVKYGAALCAAMLQHTRRN